MLRARRLQQKRLAEAEANGETFWTEIFSDSLRAIIWHYWTDVYNVYLDHDPYPTDLMASVVRLLERELGILDLAGGYTSDFALQRYWLDAGADCPTVIEAMWNVLDQKVGRGVADQFADAVNVRMREARISFDLIEGQIVEKNSQELHVAVVVPTLRLLSGRSGWENVEAAYQDALRELHGGSPGDAITDAGTALQEALQAVGCKGNALGPLLADARKRGLLAAHDVQMEEAIIKIGHWVSADRSSKGDAHKADDALQDDAWLTVHVVGSLIVRIASGLARGEART